MQTLAATERDKRIHCNWLEQLQIDALMFVKGVV
jgi:hypothetical protein